jgi:hypothetical protein
MTTPYEDKLAILSELWLNYRNDQNFEEFIAYNDLGLPLAYAIAEGIVESTDLAATFILETFELLLSGLAIEEDIGFETLDDLIEEAGE